MKLLTLATVCASFLFGSPNVRAALPGNASDEVNLTQGWRITQDVRELGEKSGWYKPDYSADWQPIDRLVHLQLLLADQPYFGRALRYFNDNPWWYRLEFVARDTASNATLRFEGVDYFAKVWLNGTLLGEHEGYADPFEFEVGRLLHKGARNVLVVKVASPWDQHYRDMSDRDRQYPFISVERNLMKGSYEHADTFVQRDVNPVGIWRPVKLILHEELRALGAPKITTSVSNNQKSATVNVVWSVFNDGQPRDVNYAVHVRATDIQKDVATAAHAVTIKSGNNILEASLPVSLPRLWTTWDRGNQPLYEATLEVVNARDVKLRAVVRFGIRSIELRRSADETRFFINGNPLYLRGATYWPDLYLSNMSHDRYERDIQAAIRAGINAFRVHVHTENPEFYEICDRLGVVLIQDNDLNWVFPADPEFSRRAVRHFGNLVAELRNHPSVVAWIAMNEVGFSAELNRPNRSTAERALGAQLVAKAREADPTRPVIENSMEADDTASGDTHDYRGSLDGGNSTYFDIFGSRDKLVTEFGVDAPPPLARLRAIPQVADRLRDVLPRVAELHDYQYQLLKYYIEHYRIQKYSPNAGYFQFMWIDFSPQSFYGVYDYWGVAKTEGLGGGLRAMQESNLPIGIFLEHDRNPIALHAVNDSSVNLGHCVARWRVSDSTGVIAEDSQPLQLGPDSHQKIRDLTFQVKEGETYKIVLDLLAADGTTLAHNTYMNPFRPLPLPKGFPDRIDEELGMRLWWAGDSQSDRGGL